MVKSLSIFALGIIGIATFLFWPLLVFDALFGDHELSGNAELAWIFLVLLTTIAYSHYESKKK